MKKLNLIFLSLCFLGTILLQAQQTDYEKSQVTEVWEPVPEVVKPGVNNSAPSDAIVLFDGSNLNNWVDGDGNPSKWVVKNNVMTAVKKAGSIYTKQKFGSCQLHIEWRTPKEVKGDGQGRGNSGVFLQSRYEVQVLDSYENKTYSNGQAGSIYKQHIPLVNVCRPPGEWQTYDIIFNAPVFNKKGLVERKATITVLQNGVLIQNNVQIQGETVWIGAAKYSKHGNAPLMLQDHSNPVSYRNIWIREL